MIKRIGAISNYLVASILLGFGLTYLLKGSFMPYHRDAVSVEWNGVDSKMQFLILALMRAASGGFLLAAFLISWLQFKFSQTKLKWLPSLILVSGTIVAVSTLYATMIVRLNTHANPPSVLIISAMILLIIGYKFNRKYSNTPG